MILPFAGLVVGIIAPLQQLFYSSRVGDEDVAPLAFIAASLNILGGAAIPSTMLVRPNYLCASSHHDGTQLRTPASEA